MVVAQAYMVIIKKCKFRKKPHKNTTLALLIVSAEVLISTNLQSMLQKYYEKNWDLATKIWISTLQAGLVQYITYDKIISYKKVG